MRLTGKPRNRQTASAGQGRAWGKQETVSQACCSIIIMGHLVHPNSQRQCFLVAFPLTNVLVRTCIVHRQKHLLLPTTLRPEHRDVALPPPCRLLQLVIASKGDELMLDSF
jgi:hypothetical protein